MSPEEFQELTPEEQADFLKRGVHALVHGGPRTVEEISRLQGWKCYNLYRYCDTDLTTHHLPHQGIVNITLLQQNFSYLDLLERLTGRVAFALPRADAGAAELGREIARTVKAFGEHLEALSAALEEASPGGAVITATEAREIEASADAAIARIAGVKELVRLLRGRKVLKGEFQVRFGGALEAGPGPSPKE